MSQTNNTTEKYIIYKVFLNNTLYLTLKSLNNALYWLFNNILLTKVNEGNTLLTKVNDGNTDNTYIDIIELNMNDIEIYQGTYKYDNGLIRYHKLYSTEFTRYSPYDLSLFNRTDLHLLYLSLLKTNPTNLTKNNTISNQKHNIDKVTIIPQKPIKKSSLKDELKSTFTSCKELCKLNTNINNEVNNISDNNSDNNSDSNDTVTSEDIKKIEEELNTMLQLHNDNKEELKSKQNELTDKVCEENFNKRMAFKNKEKEREKRNKFSASLKMYKQLYEDLELINKENTENNKELKTIYNIVPVLFLAKFYVIDFINKNDYLMDEDIDNPSEELYQIYDMLYTIKYNPNNDDNILDKYDDEFYELINEFVDYMNDKEDALDENIIRDELNKKSDVFAMI